MAEFSAVNLLQLHLINVNVYFGSGLIFVNQILNDGFQILQVIVFILKTLIL